MKTELQIKKTEKLLNYELTISTTLNTEVSRMTSIRQLEKVS